MRDKTLMSCPQSQVYLLYFFLWVWNQWLFWVVSLFLIFSTFPAHYGPPTLIVLIMTGDQENWHTYSLYLILHSPLWCTGLYCLHNIFLTKVYSHNSTDCVNVHVSLPYARMGLRALYILTFLSQASNHDLQCLSSPHYFHAFCICLLITSCMSLCN
jgi:hypothetical protein